MRFNNQSTFNGRQITNVVDRPVLHKKGKQWITIGLSTLLLAGLGTVATTGGVHAANIQNNNVNSNNINKINSNATPNSAKPSTITSQATNLHKQILNNSAMFQHNNSSATKPTVAPTAKVNPNSTSSTDSNNVKSNVGATSANNSDSNASTPNYIEDNAHYNLGSYNARQPQSTENQKEAYANYLKANPQLANLYNETANQSSSNSVANSKVASNAPKDNVNASNITSNSSASSVSANNSKVSSANQISDKKNKPLILFGANSNPYQDSDSMPIADNDSAKGRWGTAYWELHNDGKLYIHGGTITNQNWDWWVGNKPNKPYGNNDGPWYHGNLVNGSSFIGGLSYNVPFFQNYNHIKQVSNIITSDVKAPSNAYGLFMYFTNAKTIDVSGLSPTTNFYQFGNMFIEDSSLEEIKGLSHLGQYTHTVNNFDGMLNSLTNLKSIDLSTFDMSQAVSVRGLISGDSNLETVNMGGNFKLNDTTKPTVATMFGGDNKISHLILNNDAIFPSNTSVKYRYGFDNGSIVNIFDNQPNPGDWTLIDTNNPSHWSSGSNAQSAVWVLDKLGGLHVANGTITGNPKDAQNLDWNKVNNISFYNVHLANGKNASDYVEDLQNLVNDEHSIQNNLTNTENILNTTPNNWSDKAIVQNDFNNINNANSSVDDYLNAPNDNNTLSANADTSMVESAYTNANVESIIASQGAKYSAEIGSADGTINADQQYINWLKSSETSLTNASNSASSESNWIQNSGNSAYNSATNADSWVKNNSQSESNASGKASDNATAISSLMANLNAGSASATIQNAINSAVNSAENSANGALGNKATTAQISSLFNSGSGTISSVASTVANSLAGCLTSVYETQNAAGSKANSSDVNKKIDSLTNNKSGFISSVASSYASSIATSYASNAVNWVNNYGSNASNAGSWYANNSGKLTSMVNSASSIYADASSAEASLGQIKTNSDNISALNSQINNASGLTSQISSLSNEIGSVSNGSNLASELSGDYKALNSDINGNNGIKSQLDNLKDNTAITFTFTGANSDTIPATMTNGYIKANGKHVSGNTYDITNLLNEEVASKSKHVDGTYTITLGNDNNGNATVSFSNNAPQKKLAKLGVEATKPNNDMNTFKLGMPSQQNRVWNFVQNGLGRKGLILGNNNSNKVPASTDTAHNVVLANNQAEYTGTITLNFGSHQAKLNFDTGSTNPKVLASDTVNLLNYAKGANNPSDFTKDNLINGFDTTGFKFDSTTSTPNKQYSFTIQPSDATNQTGADVHSNYNITLNYSAQPVTEKINYEYQNNKGSLINEGSTTASSAADDTSSAWTTSSGTNAGWELSNTSTPFTYTNSGSVNVMVKPMPASVTVNYINQKGSNVGSQTFNGNDYRASAAGSNGINITSANDTSLASGYNLNNSNNNFSFNNSSVSISVTGHDLKPASQITPDNNTNPSDAKNNHSGKDMPKPTNDSDVLFTINVQDWNSDGTQKLGNTYTKYATETGDIGDPFTINPQDYLTYGFNMKSTKKGSVPDKSIIGTIGDTQLQPNNTTFNFYAKPYNAKDSTNPKSPNYQFTPKPITVQYVGESNGKSDQVIKQYSNILTGSTGTTGDLFDIESATKGTPKGYTVNTNQKYNDYKYTINTVPNRVITVYLNSETAKQMNNNGQNYKPTTPSDKSSTKVPSGTTISNDAKHGFATIIINENINGKSAHQSAQTVNESNLGVGDSYTIEPTSFTPNGYQVDSKDQALTGIVNPDGSLSNGSATFTYDVNDSEIAPISITYYNQYGDLIDVNTGKSSITGENVSQSQATQTISASSLATKGAINDYVDITGFLKAPKGHHFNQSIIDSSNNNLNHVQLQEAKGHNPVHLGLTLFEAMPAPKPASNSNSVNDSASASAASAETSASNAVASAKANESEAISENNSVNASKASQSAMEIASMFANNVASASNAVANADNTSATDSMEIRSLIAEINTESKSSNSSSQPIYNITINNEPKATTKTTGNNVITPINRRIPANLYYVYNPENITLHGQNNSIKISRRRGFTGRIIKATRFNGKRAYVVRWHHKNYVVNAKEVRNAYIQVKDFNRMAHGLIKHATVVLRKNAKVYKSIHFNRATKLANVKAGSKFTVVGVKTFGKKGYHQTRLVLSNGCIITANRNYVKFV